MMRAMARTVVLDLAGQAALARDLAAGGVLVPDVCTLGEDVELVLRGGGDEVHHTAGTPDEQPGASPEIFPSPDFDAAGPRDANVERCTRCRSRHSAANCRRIGSRTSQPSLGLTLLVLT